MDSAQGEAQVKQEEKMETEDTVKEKPPPPTLPPVPPVQEKVEKVEKAPKGQARSQNRAAPSSTVTPASGPSQSATLPQYHIAPTIQGSASKYAQLLALIDEMGKDIRPTYTGNRNCAERLKKEITHARVLVRECLLEVEKNARSQQ